MKISEIIDIIKELQEVMLEDFRSEYKRDPKSNKELLNHIKDIYNNEEEEERLIEFSSIDDLEYPKDVYKMILVSSIYNLTL